MRQLTLANGLELLLLDDLDGYEGTEHDTVLVTGAHGGLLNARRILRRPPRLVIFHDAGRGKDDSGIAGLELLEGFNVAAAAVAHSSARIGDASDVLEHGVIAVANSHAGELGLEASAGLKESLQKLTIESD